MEDIKMRTKSFRHVKASDLVDNPRNWRTHPVAQRSALEGVLNEIGFAGAILTRKLDDGKLEIIDGHLRKNIALGEKVPVLITDLTREEADLLLAIYDPIAGMADADKDVFSELLNSVTADDSRVQELLESVRHDYKIEPPENTGVGGIDPNVEPEVPDKKDVITKRNDLWILGEHRLLCGDSTNRDDVALLMDGQKAKLFSTDPPYLVGYDGKNHPHAFEKKDGNKDWTGSYGEVNWDEWNANSELFNNFIKVALEFIEPNAAWYCWYASVNHSKIEKAWVDNGAFVHQQIIWFKDRPILTRSWYMWQHEPCLFGWIRGNKPERCSDDYPRSVWELPTVKPGEKTEHPTSKPIEVFEIPMLQHTRPGGICYEPFCGSGSQLIAAEKNNRRCFSMEISEQYCDVILRRWAEWTGEDPVRAKDNASWNELLQRK